jgi:type II secretory pathway pseudopilin PulG
MAALASRPGVALRPAVQRRLARSERGIGLTELIVSMALLGIVSLIVMGLYASTMRTVTQARSLSNNTREASNGMNEVSRVIRAATENPVSGQTLNDPAFVSTVAAPMTGESVTLYAYVNLTSSTQQPVKIRLSLDANRRLVETQWASIVLSPGFFGFSTTPSSAKIMAGAVAAQVAGGPALFTYLLADGTELAVPATGTFTVAQLRTIAAVKVTMTLQASAANTQSAVTLQNTVGMPNLPLTRTG